MGYNTFDLPTVQSPSSRAPVFVLDQQIVQALGAGCAPVYFAWPMIRAAARTGDVGPAVLTVAAGLIMALLLVRGSGPVRGAVADRRSFARGFARRRWRAVLGAGLVALAWLTMLAASTGALLAGGGSRVSSWAPTAGMILRSQTSPEKTPSTRRISAPTTRKKTSM